MAAFGDAGDADPRDGQGEGGKQMTDTHKNLLRRLS